ncbi:hypothetical protein [Methylobacterium sp. WL9]|uniref:hypothetical protein n=1 Tax=Methylobacterium sp. WL9 TaxID=2603898 RepID=UPI0011CC021D|nr:hypothetical protein [Methylobacterium sp. WL9]TXN22152.1 hypothetical protein FV217_11805 [Methylobacterium sp. WL9]
MRALIDVDAPAIAYLETAHGDAEQALRWAVVALIRTEVALAEARNAVSRGYVPASLLAGAIDLTFRSCHWRLQP